MTDLTTTLTGTASIPAGSLSIPAQTIQVSITIPAQTVQLGVESAPVAVTLDETALAAALKPLIISQPGTVVTTSSSGIVDAQGNVWTITTNAQIAVNGVVDESTANVVTLAPTAGSAPQIYQVNKTGGCWSKVNATAPWVETTFPAIAT